MSARRTEELVCDMSVFIIPLQTSYLPARESGMRVYRWPGVVLSDLSLLSNELSRFLFTFPILIVALSTSREHLMGSLTSNCSLNTSTVFSKSFYPCFMLASGLLYGFDSRVFQNLQDFDASTWLLFSCKLH